MTPKKNIDTQLADDIAEFYADPLGYVMYMFPWDSDPSLQLVKLKSPWRERYDCEYGPDEWACEFLDQLGEEVRKRGFDGKTPVAPIRFSTVSGHEIGKSCLVAWLIKWIMDTRPFSKGSVTATTDEQLRTKTWAELGKWHKLSLTSHWFKYNIGRGSMSLVNTHFPERWRCDAKTCREEKSEAFAGQHAPESTSFYIFDEASGVPNKPFEVREGGLTSGEPMVFDFGNGTRNSGMFFENCVGRYKDRYLVRMIDSRDVQITNKAKIEQDRVDFGGEESDFFRVRWRGMFPDASTTQFIPGTLVRQAQERELIPNKKAVLVLGVDVARFGDDESIIKPAVGSDFRSFAAKRYKGLDTKQLSDEVIKTVRDFLALGMQVRAINVDGTGLGAGVVDNLKHLGYPVNDIQFGAGPLDKKAYRMKSDELWGTLKNDMESLCFPEEDTEEGMMIYDQLTQREYGHTLKGQVHLESKTDMKERGVQSPDLGDAYALCRAVVPAPDEVDTLSPYSGSNTTKSDYDPFAEAA